MILLSTPTDDEKEEMLGARFQLIFCFQKRLQSKIFQARFRAFKVLLLRSFYTNSYLLSILETLLFSKKNYEMIRYHTDSS